MCLRWGICGAGKISNDFVIGLKGYGSKADHSVVAVGARSVDSAAKFATTHVIERYYGSYEELAKDSEIDVVYIGTIHPTHMECVQLMLKSGKSVLCEKPLTMNVQDTKSLIQSATNCGVFLMEGMWTRFFPSVVELRRQISDGSIGEVKVVQANFGFKRKDTSGTSRLDNPELGGGAVLDVGVYPISFATMIFRERPKNIHATGWLTSSGVDEFVSITLSYSGERVAHLSCSIGVDLVNDAFVYGSNGRLKLPHPFWCSTKLETPKGSFEYPLPDVSLPLNFQNSEGFGYEAEHVRLCLKAGKKQSDIMPLEHTLIVAEIMESVMKQLGTIHFNV